VLIVPMAMAASKGGILRLELPVVRTTGKAVSKVEAERMKTAITHPCIVQTDAVGDNSELLSTSEGDSDAFESFHLNQNGNGPTRIKILEPRFESGTIHRFDGSIIR
jgi:hypothetical protein